MAYPRTKSELGEAIFKADLQRDLGLYSEAIEGLSSKVLTQTTWYVNSDTGDDTATGLTSETAILTLKELRNRWKSGALSGDCKVYLSGNFSSQDLSIEPKFDEPSDTLAVLGTPVQVSSGALTGFTPRIGASNQDMRLTDSSQDWTTLVGKRVRFTSGAALGAVCWVLKADPGSAGTDVARISQPGIYDESIVPFTEAITAVNPASSDTYVVEDVTSVGSILSAPTMGVDSNVLFADIEVTGNSVFTAGPFYSTIIARSKIGSNNLDVGGVTFALSQLTSAGAKFMNAANTVVIKASCVIAPAFVILGPGLVGLEESNVLQGTGIFSSPPRIYSNSDLGIFDAAYGVRTTARVELSAGILYGDGVTGVGVAPSGGSLIVYDSLPVLPSTPNAQVAGSDYTYAQLPQFVNGAGVVPE